MAQQPEPDAWGRGDRVEEEIQYPLLVLPPTHMGRSVRMHTHMELIIKESSLSFLSMSLTRAVFSNIMKSRFQLCF